MLAEAAAAAVLALCLSSPCSQMPLPSHGSRVLLIQGQHVIAETRRLSAPGNFGDHSRK
jgi:hypothetical protein